MNASQIIDGLSGFDARGAGTDAERRAGLWLADRLREAGREVLVETFWCRPNTDLAHFWHAVLGIAGSVVAVNHQRVGAALLVIAAFSALADAAWGVSLGRRFTPERASQNVIGLPPRHTRRRRVSLVLTANYDAGRAAVVDRDEWRVPLARARTRLRGITPGWQGWLELTLLALIGVAVARYEGATGTLIGVVQLILTVGLVIAATMLAERASAKYGPSAGDNASGVAAALELARALDAEPLEQAAVHVVLTGAGDTGCGLHRYLRDRRSSMRGHNTVVIGVGPCGGGRTSYWHSDGPFVPLRYFKALRKLARDCGGQDPELRLERHHGRGTTSALPARIRGLPAISIGCLDARGLSPRSHQAQDTAAALEPQAFSDTVRFGLLLADNIDCFLVEFAPTAAADAAREQLTVIQRLGRIADWAGRPVVRGRRPG